MGSLILFLSVFLRLLLTVLLLSHFAFANNFSTSMQPPCLDEERSTLLEFKHNFVIDLSASSFEGAYPKVLSWKAQGKRRNCCEWDGIQCDEKTGHVIDIDLSSSFLFGSINSNSSLFRLVHLRSLNLADNHFNFSRIPVAVGRFSRMTSLNLSASMFSGQIPAEISGLSKLSSLDLSQNYLNQNGEKLLKLKHPNLKSLVQNLTRLEKLNLNFVDISSELPDVLTNLSSLTWLSLRDCGLYGVFPAKIFQMPKLQILRTQYNENLTGNLPEFHRRSPLTILRLGYTGFFGNIPSSIENLDSLELLDLYNCKFYGQIPYSLGKLSKLTQLNFGYNKLSGQIPSSLQNLTQLTTFNLPGNQLSGPIPPWLGNLTQLVDIHINENQLNGSIPESLSKLMSLTDLFLHYNKLAGTVNFDMFFNMKSLGYLELGFNNLSLHFGKGNVNATVSKFKFLGLSMCNSTKFPDFIRHQRELEWLALSGSNIHGQIPKWMWNTSTQTLVLVAVNSNFLTGLEQPPAILPWVRLRVLDLNSNMLQGRLPIPPPSTSHYDVSYNSLTGEIPPLICNLSSLNVLDLSNNYLSGKIPQCLENFSESLQVLKLSKNAFHGKVPRACTRPSQLKMIDLSHNQFQGELPQSLANCIMLESLDLQDNHLLDVFPTWLGTLPELKLLILRKNGFYGAIGGPQTGSFFPKLRVIDLSFNSFSGKLPFAYLFIWNAMKSFNANDSTYMEVYETVDVTGTNLDPYFNYYPISITIVTKGVERNYPKILEVFAAIDLSSNKFTGEIPEAFGILKGLQSLNLSNNMLTGSIPSSLGSLSNLESLDLSQNKLSGEVPQQLVQLNFLQSFDISHNNLRGRIPQGNQLNTFDNSSFEANPGLCGNPLSKKCENSNASPPQSSVIGDEDDSGPAIEFDRKFIVAGFISGLVVGFSLGDILIMKRQCWLVKTIRKRPVKRRRGRRNN